jgi:hypothetical protein
VVPIKNQMTFFNFLDSIDAQFSYGFEVPKISLKSIDCTYTLPVGT